MNALVIGCGRVGSSIALQLDWEGWDVTAVDEKEEALTRLGDHWKGGFVLGSAPRWRRQSRFFSPTVEYVLRKAPCEVLVVAFPEGVMEEDGEGSQ